MTCTGNPPDPKGDENGDPDLPPPKKDDESDKETRDGEW